MQEAPGSWNYASLLCGKSEETRRRHHRNTFTEITRVVTHFVFNSKPSAVDVRDTWHPWPLKPVPDPRGRWIPRTTVTMFIVVALTLAVICGSVFGLLMYRPVMLIRVAVRTGFITTSLLLSAWQTIGRRFNSLLQDLSGRLEDRRQHNS
eukprot:Gregarina_sp_Poly_1__6796@NODE_3672_length_939_cov_21_233945_g2343_i0_p1_GENE_NODE_3672_length_939_cov_21_233945_g2343_i0NODE_3672_length_939_cov_21_233945_g2343_i0_p1_ORF_typecomplete_len150_score8_21_NODE_3672_length_939_cov_21_233945_g2343_i0143592